MRTAALALIVAVASGGAAAACIIDQASLTDFPGSITVDATTSGEIARAWYADATTRYDHHILGREVEPETLWVDVLGNRGTCGHTLTLDADHVFEDVAPRLVDVDGDGTHEIVAVRTHVDKGAQLAVFDWDGTDLRLAATTPYVGETHRWLAPIGVADLDGDGSVEIAYIDRPHLARTLRIVSYRDGTLAEIAAGRGFTNHRIGETDIGGGIRNCDGEPEMIVADADWTRVNAVRLTDGTLTARAIGPYEGRDSFAAALDCRS